ncbi:MAG TPA: cytochrome C oxidase subunit IV family protein [Gemmatimonadales bacterium]|nr:cytochrome C oxidase subunit IV family protein [Gemmatimonadales bacterium]
MATTTHKHPPYIMIWIYLAVLTALELGLAFEFARNWTFGLKLTLLMILAIWKALLVALYFMHLKFEKWNLRLVALFPLPLTLILLAAGMSEHIW